VQGGALPIFLRKNDGMATKDTILTKTDDFIKWFLPKIEKFHRVIFGMRTVPTG